MFSHFITMRNFPRGNFPCTVRFIKKTRTIASDAFRHKNSLSQPHMFHIIVKFKRITSVYFFVAKTKICWDNNKPWISLVLSFSPNFAFHSHSSLRIFFTEKVIMYNFVYRFTLLLLLIFLTEGNALDTFTHVVDAGKVIRSIENCFK